MTWWQRLPPSRVRWPSRSPVTVMGLDEQTELILTQAPPVTSAPIRASATEDLAVLADRDGDVERGRGRGAVGA